MAVTAESSQKKWPKGGPNRSTGMGFGQVLSASMVDQANALLGPRN